MNDYISLYSLLDLEDILYLIPNCSFLKTNHFFFVVKFYNHLNISSIIFNIIFRIRKFIYYSHFYQIPFYYNKF